MHETLRNAQKCISIMTFFCMFWWKKEFQPIFSPSISATFGGHHRRRNMQVPKFHCEKNARMQKKCKFPDWYCAKKMRKEVIIGYHFEGGVGWRLLENYLSLVLYCCDGGAPFYFDLSQGSRFFTLSQSSTQSFFQEGKGNATCIIWKVSFSGVV